MTAHLGCGSCAHLGCQHLPLGGGCLVCACTAWTPPVITYSTSTNTGGAR